MLHRPMPRIAHIGVIALALLAALTACTTAPPATARPQPSNPGGEPTRAGVTPAASATLPPSSPSAIAVVPSPGRATATRAPMVRASPGPPLGVARGVIRFSAFQTDPGTVQVATVQPDGSGWQVLGALSGHPWGPKASPDGSLLLFSSAAPATQGRAPDLDLNGSGSPDIWVAGTDGSQARRLTDAPAGYNGWSWAPDGRRIAFASNRNGSWDIYALALAGGAPTRLTTSTAQDGWPVWTPDGKEIVFASTRSDRAQLYRMAADGSNVRRLLASATADTEPAIAPGGAIAFSAQNPDGTGEVYVLNSGASAPRRLTSAGGLSTTPTWSPDGRQIAFVNRRDGRSDLYVVNADGSGLARLTSAGQNLRPDWGARPTDEFARLMQQQVAQAESRLRRGALEATLDDGAGSQAIMQVRFDLGDGSAPRLHVTTTGQGPQAPAPVDRITIGDRAWQRQADGHWQPVAPGAGIQEQLVAYLPRIASARQVTADPLGLLGEVYWVDTAADADVTLLAEAQSGLPVRMQRVDRRTGRILTVVYDWNAPADIDPPTP